MDDEIDTCCGNFCDKALLANQLKKAGACEFVDFLEATVAEDFSAEAIHELLLRYVATL